MVPQQGPRDYPHDPINYVNFGSEKEPSWKEALLKAFVTITTALVVVGIPSIITMFFTINTRLASIEAHQAEGTQRFDEKQTAMERHLEADDKRLDELYQKLPLWRH